MSIHLTDIGGKIVLMGEDDQEVGSIKYLDLLELFDRVKELERQLADADNRIYQLEKRIQNG